MSSTIHMNVPSLHHHHHHHNHHLNNHHLNSHSNEMILKCNSNNNGNKKRLNGFCANSNIKSAQSHMNNGSKMNYNSHNNHGPPSSVARRNERERNRVKMVNMGFATLRQHVPNGTKNKKMSKVETLRSAVEYIRQLQKLLGQTNGTSSNNENECYNGNNDYEQYTLQQVSLSGTSATSPGSGTGSNGDVENCYSTTMLSPTSITLVDNGLMEQNYSNSPNKQHITMYMDQPNHNHHNHHHHHHQNHQNPHQHSTSPSPSIDSSDLTGSSTSPYTAESNVLSNHPNHHSHTQYDTASANDADDELFDFVNWF